MRRRKARNSAANLNKKRPGEGWGVSISPVHGLDPRRSLRCSMRWIAFTLTLLLLFPGWLPARAEEAQFAQPMALGVLPQVPFVDRFEADLQHRWVASDGWHSGDLFSTEWRRSQISQAPEGVSLILAPSPGDAQKPYVSGELNTRDQYLYGYFETRLRMPRGAGLVGAFFTFTRPDGVASWNEIDMEFLGRDPHRLELVYHVAGEATLEVIALPFDASADFHTYGFEWRPEGIRWFVDNRLVHTSRGGRVRELNRPQRIFTSLWNSEHMPRWLGVIDPTEAPWRLDVACIAYAPRYLGRPMCTG